MTARKVLVAKKLIELAGGYKEAVDPDGRGMVRRHLRHDEAAGGASRADKDQGMTEPNPQKGVGGQSPQGYGSREAAASGKRLLGSTFTFWITVVIVLRGKEGYQQMLVVRDAAAGYHDRVFGCTEKEGPKANSGQNRRSSKRTRRLLHHECCHSPNLPALREALFRKSPPSPARTRTLTSAQPAGKAEALEALAFAVGKIGLDSPPPKFRGWSYPPY